MVMMSHGSFRLVGRVSRHAAFSKRQQNLSVGTELDDPVSLASRIRKLRELVLGRAARVGHPHVAVAVDVKAVGEDEDTAADGAHQFP